MSKWRLSDDMGRLEVSSLNIWVKILLVRYKSKRSFWDRSKTSIFKEQQGDHGSLWEGLWDGKLLENGMKECTDLSYHLCQIEKNWPPMERGAEGQASDRELLSLVTDMQSSNMFEKGTEESGRMHEEDPWVWTQQRRKGRQKTEEHAKTQEEKEHPWPGPAACPASGPPVQHALSPMLLTALNIANSSLPLFKNFCL